MSLPAARVPSRTVRTRIAGIALQAALAVDGVVAGDAGPHRLHVTVGGPGGPLVGVRAVAEPGGGYGVDLGIRAGLVPLAALADRLRAAVREAAAAAGLVGELGPVSVTFHDVADPDEELAHAFGVALDAADGSRAR